MLKWRAEAERRASRRGGLVRARWGTIVVKHWDGSPMSNFVLELEMFNVAWELEINVPI